MNLKYAMRSRNEDDTSVKVFKVRFISNIGKKLRMDQLILTNWSGYGYSKKNIIFSKKS